MRSTNLVIVLVLLNASAVMAGAIGLTDIGYTPDIGGGDEIDEAQSTAETISTERSALDEFVAGIIAAADSVRQIFGIAIAGPTMLANLGVPGPIVAFLAAPLYILVGLDILQVISGRALS